MTECPEAVHGIHDVQGRRDGRCTWCLAYVTGAARRPVLTQGHMTVNGTVISGYVSTDLYDAYRYHYDPDWGINQFDH